MPNVNVTIRMDEKLRLEGAKLFDDLGMGLNQAINIFVRQAVREQRIPFEIRRFVPNKETLEAFEEVEKINSGQTTFATYENAEDMVNDIFK